MTAQCRLKAAGFITALGEEPEMVFRALIAGDQGRLVCRDDLLPDRRIYVGEAPLGVPVELPPELERLRSRNTELLARAFSGIEQQVAEVKSVVGAHRVAVVLGSSTSGIGAGEQALAALKSNGRFPATYHYEQQELGSVARFLADYAGLGGPAYTISTACSSSAKVFGSGRALLSAGLCDAVIAGGADSLCRLTTRGFASLELVSAFKANPMSRNRAGLNIGEGAALFLMTREEGGVQLLGVGESSDAFHMSAPEPSGRGAAEAMRAALNDAGCAPGEIDYINLHGTGTLHNDAAESLAIAEIFGLDVPCSSVKQILGHTLGASGAIEAAVCWLVLSRSEPNLPLPPHMWDGDNDLSLPQLRLVKSGDSIAAAGRFVHLMSNSFAFGGSNCSLVFGRNLM